MMGGVIAMDRELKFVIITGLSGAGKSQAIKVLEDDGYFCVDNLPPALLPTFVELCARTAERVSRVAIVMDLRGGEFFKDLFEALGLSGHKRLALRGPLFGGVRRDSHQAF
jgi:RNase adapter protein RapZ